MNAEELLAKIIAYGGDESGIRDRFGGNAALYEACFRDFMVEPNFAVLAEAVEKKEYQRAFEAAHALKGLSGNLGVTGFYEAACVLVESLRAGRYAHVEEEYAELARQRQNLAAVVADRQPAPAPISALGEDAEPAEDKPGGPARGKDRFVLKSLLAGVAAVCLVGYLFCRISINFNDNVVKESGQHLTEMSNQIRLYVEEQIANDWRVAYSVGDSIEDGRDWGSDQAILEMLRRKQAVWGVSDLMLYTEDGYCVYSGGSTEGNDIASEAIVRAREQGRYLSVIDSRIIYTVPLQTERRFNGSRIAAVSVVQDMETFLDDMNFSSFDEKAWMYLTEESGVVISALTNEAAVPAFNFKSVVAGKELTPLDKEHPAGKLMSASAAEAFLMSGGGESTYVVSAPVITGVTPLRLFYLAPEAVVNRTMNGFSRRLTIYSMLIIVLFAVFAFVAFLQLYRNRKKRFAKAIMARDRMFDLLIQNTRTAFALFTAGRREPDYISANAVDVVGDAYWALDKTGDGYRMRNDTDTDTDVLRQANGMLRGWDGTSVFRSGYIRNEGTVPPYYFQYELYPIDGEGKDFVGIAQDVTQAYEREEVAKAAMEMAERANEAKSRFLSNMSHDIRTPMNAIMNMTNFALENIDNPKKLGPYLHTIHESSEHLLHLINDVLDMSRIESGQTVIADVPFDLKAEVQRQADMIRPLCEAKEQTFMTDFDGLRTTAVCGDALKLAQIIMNLLSNAVKFTPEKGAVRFTAREIPSLREEMVDVRFIIEDNGIGISEKNIKHIFDSFYRADDAHVGRIEGTGLGLSICKNYVEAMGGSLRCESEEGEGSTFTVELFFAKAGAGMRDGTGWAALGDTPFLGMRCLVMEDNGTNQLIAKTLLERLGFLVDLADDGGQGVRAFLASKPGTYDVVYLDIRMPVLDGYQAAVRIRESEHPQAGKIPLVAMTANAFAEDIERARMAGMDAYVGKPIVSFDLIEQTMRAIRNKRGKKQ